MSNTVLIVQLEYPIINNVENTNFKINGVPTAKVNISNIKYKVVNGIFSFTDTNNVRYTNMLRQNNQWFEVNNQEIKKKPWPKSSKNLKILFLEQI